VALVAALAVFAEARLVSPVAGLPSTSLAVHADPITALAQAPPGAVMNFPVAGGRRYLFEQTLHHKPLTGGLNFPNNATSRRVWKVIVDGVGDDRVGYRQRVEATACAEGVGYLVVHVDAMARPDVHDRGVKALHHSLPVLASTPSLRVHQLCQETPG
jgi:hypothetical protein